MKQISPREIVDVFSSSTFIPCRTQNHRKTLSLSEPKPCVTSSARKDRDRRPPVPRPLESISVWPAVIRRESVLEERESASYRGEVRWEMSREFVGRCVAIQGMKR